MRLVLGQEGHALGGEGVELAPALLLGGRGVAHVLDHRQGRIDDAGARAVAAADALAERLDDLVTVARLLGQHGENDQPEVAGIEHAALARFETAAPMAAEAPVAAEAVMRAAPATFLAKLSAMLAVVGKVSEMH